MAAFATFYLITEHTEMRSGLAVALSVGALFATTFLINEVVGVEEPVLVGNTSSSGGGNCHPSYRPCVPKASDVDCRGGGGDGPVYVGRVSVIGPDVYGLDGDGDGVGCE